MTLYNTLHDWRVLVIHFLLVTLNVLGYLLDIVSDIRLCTERL